MNIDLVHSNMAEHSKAISYYEQGVDIGQQSLSENHFDMKGWRRKLETPRTQV